MRYLTGSSTVGRRHAPDVTERPGPAWLA